MNIFDFMDRADEIRKKKLQQTREWRASRRRKVNVDDLTRRFHQVGPEEPVKFPTVFAYEQLKKYFDPELKTIDLSNNMHLAAVLYFLQNGNNTHIVNYNAQTLQDAILDKMAEMEMSHIPYYVENITQIFLALQKKTLENQEKTLQAILKRTEAGATFL